MNVSQIRKKKKAFVVFFREPVPPENIEQHATTTTPALSAVESSQSQTFSLGLGERKVLLSGAEYVNDVVLILDEINDSRCPPDVQCIRAGEVKIKITLCAGRDECALQPELIPGGTVNFYGWKVDFIKATPKEPTNTDASRKPKMTFSVVYIGE